VLESHLLSATFALRSAAFEAGPLISVTFPRRSFKIKVTAPLIAMTNCRIDTAWRGHLPKLLPSPELPSSAPWLRLP
jgi:hypothetical protein